MRPVPRRAACLAAAVATVLSSAPASATLMQVSRSDLSDLSLEQLSNVVVTSVSRREEKLSQAAASIYVITAQEIRASGATTLPEALRLAPNLDIARADAVQYAISARGFNNVLANKMLVMIDGRTVYTPLFSGVFWEAQDVLLEDVERIEVISGPGGTLWGANAVNGVINVITKRASDTQGALAWIGSGNRETSGAARFGGELLGGHYRIYAKSTDRSNSEREDGADIRDSSQLMQAGFRADWGTHTGGFTLQGDAYDGSVDQAGPSRELSGTNLLGRWAHELEGGGSLRIQAYYDRTTRFHPNSFREALDTWDFELQHGFQVARHNVVWGGGYRESRDNIENFPPQAFLPPDITLRWANLFAQDTFALTDDVDLTLGAKVERNSYTGNEFLPTARVAWRLGQERFAWGAVSRAVRAPSRIDRDLYIPATPPYALAGGSDFDSEVATIYELGFRARPSDRWSYSVTAFRHDYDRLRSIGLNGSFQPTFQNALEGTSSGLEAWGRWQVVPAFSLAGGFVVQDVKVNVKAGEIDLGGRGSLGNDPDHWVKLRATWAITPALEADAFVRYYGALPAPVVPSYTAVDVRVGWKVLPSLELALVVQNLFDDKHVEWGASPNRAAFQRTAFLKATWRP
jgi:iron complex outermembrane receptor protein